MGAQWFRIPGMSNRRSVRAISATVSDVAGVRTVEARLDTGTIRVTGTADPTAVQDAILLAGYDVVAVPGHPSVDGVAAGPTAMEAESAGRPSTVAGPPATGSHRRTDEPVSD